jgi:hypothetical protein
VGTPLSERLIYVQKLDTKKENIQIGIPESRTPLLWPRYVDNANMCFVIRSRPSGQVSSALTANVCRLCRMRHSAEHF